MSKILRKSSTRISTNFLIKKACTPFTLFSCFVGGYPLYFGVLLPAGAIILMNLIILIIVLRSLANKPHVNTSKEEKSELREKARCVVSFRFLTSSRQMKTALLVRVTLHMRCQKSQITPLRTRHPY